MKLQSFLSLPLFCTSHLTIYDNDDDDNDDNDDGYDDK